MGVVLKVRMPLRTKLHLDSGILNDKNSVLGINDASLFISISIDALPKYFWLQNLATLA